MEKRAAMTSKRYQLTSACGLRPEIWRVNIDTIRVENTVSICAASAAITKLLERNPPEIEQ